MHVSFYPTEEINDCIYEGVVRQWSDLAQIELLNVQDAENRDVYLDSVMQWEELASNNGLEVGQTTITEGTTILYSTEWETERLP